MADPRTELTLTAELQHVDDWKPDGSVDEANGVWGMHDPPSGVRNTIIRLSFSDPQLALWVKERPGFWTVTLTPPEAS